MTFDAMTDLAQRSARAAGAGLRASQALPVVTEQNSTDGTRKWLFDVGQGNAIETVFIPEDDRGTLCISSQAGCAVGLPLLFHRPPGLQPQPAHQRNHRPAVVGRSRVLDLADAHAARQAAPRHRRTAASSATW